VTQFSWNCAADNGLLMIRAGCISSLDGKARNTHSTLGEEVLGRIN